MKVSYTSKHFLSPRNMLQQAQRQMAVGGQHHAPADYYQQKAPVPIVEEAKWAP